MLRIFMILYFLFCSRPANSPVMNFKSVIHFTILVPGTVTILLPYCLLRIDHDLPPTYTFISAVIGSVLIALGLIVYLLCAWDFAAAGKGTPAPLAGGLRLLTKSTV
jgi:hypothetical protein